MKCIVLQTSVGHTTGFILSDRDITHTAGRCVYLAAPGKIERSGLRLFVVIEEPIGSWGFVTETGRQRAGRAILAASPDPGS